MRHIREFFDQYTSNSENRQAIEKNNDSSALAELSDVNSLSISKHLPLGTASYSFIDAIIGFLLLDSPSGRTSQDSKIDDDPYHRKCDGVVEYSLEDLKEQRGIQSEIRTNADCCKKCCTHHHRAKRAGENMEAPLLQQQPHISAGNLLHPFSLSFEQNRIGVHSIILSKLIVSFGRFTLRGTQ